MTYRNFITPLAIAASAAAYGYSTEAAQAATSTVTGAEACLHQHTGKLDTLLTRQDIAPYVQDADADVETKYDKVHTHELSYTWASDRTLTMSVSGMEISTPMPNTISLGGIESYTESDYYDSEKNNPVKRFQRFHHNLTEEEWAKAKAAMNENMKDESETTRKIANKLLGAANARIAFETVEDIGDAAAWNIKAKELDVLIGETEFSVTADISDDKKKNKAAASELAQAVLSNCTDASDE